MKTHNQPSPNRSGVPGIDRILEDRNVDGKVPWDVFWRLIDDMALLPRRMESWSCATYYRFSMHDQCPRSVHAADSRRAA